VWELHAHKLIAIAKSFHQADNLTGRVRMAFAPTAAADSDGNSMIDVYVHPQNAEAAETLLADPKTRHMQFLETMVPAAVMGYQFVLTLEAQEAPDVRVTLLETIPPMAGAVPV